MPLNVLYEEMSLKCFLQVVQCLTMGLFWT